MTASSNMVAVEHTMATDGYLIPIRDLECKRTVVDGQITREEFFVRGKVYALVYNWDDGVILDNITDEFCKPANPIDWSVGYKSKKDPSYPFPEFYPWQALKLFAYNVRYDSWRSEDYVVGNNNWAEPVPEEPEP